MAECLGIDGKLAHHLAFVYRSRANETASSARDDGAELPSWVRAGFLCRAASYAAVAEENDLTDCFKRAAKGAAIAFREQMNGKGAGVPMWLVPAIELNLSGHLQHAALADLLSFLHLLPLADARRLRAVIMGITRDRNGLAGYEESQDSFDDFAPVGRLGIPLAIYIGLGGWQLARFDLRFHFTIQYGSRTC